MVQALPLIDTELSAEACLKNVLIPFFKEQKRCGIHRYIFQACCHASVRRLTYYFGHALASQIRKTQLSRSSCRHQPALNLFVFKSPTNGRLS